MIFIFSILAFAEELIHGFGSPGYTVEPDRRRAIRIGITAARKNDTVLIAGKGHETYQIIGRKKTSFDDRVEARKVLDESNTMECH